MSAPAGVPGYTGPTGSDAVTTAAPDRLDVVERHPDVADRSLGELVGQLSGDLSRLVRQEMALAKTEAKEEATAAGKGIGLLGGAGVAGDIALIFVSLALMFGLGALMPLGWAALIVGVLWAGVAAFLALRGKAQLKQLSSPLPETTETLKEDAQWARSLNS